MNRNDFTFIKEPPPHDKTEWVAVLAQIKNNKTGEVRTYKTTATWDDDDGPGLWIWEEGNFSCDCNRYLFFQRAKDEEEQDVSCSDGGYSVNIINPKNNEILYKEFAYPIVQQTEGRVTGSEIIDNGLSGTVPPNAPQELNNSGGALRPS